MFFGFENFKFASKEDKDLFLCFEKDLLMNRFLKFNKVNHDNKSIKNIFQQKY